MSVQDFCRCTPSEFRHIYDSWNDKETKREQRNWERTRLLCCYIIQPYSKKEIKVTDVIKFPWEEKAEEKAPITDEELHERYKAAKERLGLQ